MQKTLSQQVKSPYKVQKDRKTAEKTAAGYSYPMEKAAERRKIKRLSTAAGKKVSAEQAEGRKSAAQCALSRAKTAAGRLPGGDSAETGKMPEQHRFSIRRGRRCNTEPGQPHIPQIMTVAPELRKPVINTVTRKTRFVVDDVRRCHSTCRYIQNQNRPQNRADDTSRKMLVRNTEIRKKTDCAFTYSTPKPKHPKKQTVTDIGNNTAPVKSVPVHLSPASVERAACRRRGSHFTPML